MLEKLSDEKFLNFYSRDDISNERPIDNLRTNYVKKILDRSKSEENYNLEFIQIYCKSLLEDLTLLIQDASLLNDITKSLENIIDKISNKKFRNTDYFMLAEYESLVRTAYSKIDNLVSYGVNKSTALSTIKSGISILKRNVEFNSPNFNKIELTDGSMIEERTSVNGFDFVIIIDHKKLTHNGEVKYSENRFSIIFGEVKSTSMINPNYAPKLVRQTPTYQSADMVTKYLTVHKHLNNYLHNNLRTTLEDFRVLYKNVFSYYLKSINSARMSKFSYRLSRYATPFYLYTKSAFGEPIIIPIDPKQVANSRKLYGFASSKAMFPQGIVDENFNLNQTLYENYNPSLWPSFEYRNGGKKIKEKVDFETRKLIEKLGLEKFNIKQLQLTLNFSSNYEAVKIVDPEDQKEIKEMGRLNVFSIVLPSSYSKLKDVEKQKLKLLEKNLKGIILMDKTNQRKRNRKLLFYDHLRILNYKLPIHINGKLNWLEIKGNYIFRSPSGRISRLFYWIERQVSQYNINDYKDMYLFPLKLVFIVGIGIKQISIKNKYSIGPFIALCQIAEFDKLPFRVIRPFESIHLRSRKRKKKIAKLNRKSRPRPGSPPAGAVIRFKNNLDILENNHSNKVLWSRAVKRINILSGNFGGRGNYFSPKYFHNRSEAMNRFADWLIIYNYPIAWHERLKLILTQKLEKESINLVTLRN